MTCGGNKMNLNLSQEFKSYGQYNFILAVACTENLVWALNGSVLNVTKEIYEARSCSNMGQKFVLTLTSGAMNITFEQQQLLQQQLIYTAGLQPGSINVDVSSNPTNQNFDHQIVVTINDNASGSLIHNLTQIYNKDSTKLSELLNGSNITHSSVDIKTLTFNETVGTQRGCAKKMELMIISFRSSLEISIAKTLLLNPLTTKLHPDNQTKLTNLSSFYCLYFRLFL
jgi:hypothetical protein